MGGNAQWYRLLLLAAYGLRGSVGMTQQFFFFFVPVTLTFDPQIRTLVRFLYNAANRHVSPSYV